MESMAFLVFISLAFLLITTLYQSYLPGYKGTVGEKIVARQLQRLNKNEYTVLNNIYLKVNGRSIQIDHLVLSVYGIFVIETKNYSGWIHGNENSEFWTQTFYKKKIKFGNPVKQNRAHIYFLKRVLASYKQLDYYSIIVFAGDGTLKNVCTQTPVVYKNRLIKTIRQVKTPVLSGEQVVEVADQIRRYRVIDRKVIKEHKNYVRRSYFERNRKINALICPDCGGELVVRNGKYGEFYGCSNFPRCRFIQSL